MARVARSVLAIAAFAALSFFLAQGAGVPAGDAFPAGSGQSNVINDLGWG
ncbi:hypothetical protein HDA41_003408 [Streptomyces caelestis]|jgi:hypothetical protein|uniref:Uncharacterized protein n=1 Tax=Streptomyces caelestis TaxID=36816 RepID=A0A7W9H4X6_9ACTN|nr:hypothetical protein [Streptomyces caelestis]